MTNLWLFFLLFFRVGVFCGFAVSIPLVVMAECCGWKVLEVGIEQVSERAVSQNTSVVLTDGNKPAPEVLEVAA